MTADTRRILTDDEGYLYDADEKGRLTPCCKAPVTFSDHDLCCKGCWAEMDHSLLSPPLVDGKWLQ